jgi:radical SAM protein with 4Fe4S-binding SPASM domain
VRLTPEQAVSLEFRDPVRRAEYLRMAEGELATEHRRSTRRYVCGGGHNGCAIDPNGQMTICVLSHRDGYDMRNGSFTQGWQTRLHEIRETKNTRETICTTCRITSLCSMCAANGELENGDAEKPVDFLCRVAHLRAFALGLAVPAHGDCACCPGGAEHPSLREAAERFNKDSALLPNVVVPPKSNALLPVLGTSGGCSAGGCSSCGSNFR